MIIPPESLNPGMNIPSQLKTARFIPIAYGEKGCKVKDWNIEDNQLDYDTLSKIDKTNYGVVAGTSHLCLIDIDKPDHPKVKEMGALLPPTFTVATGKGRHHYYSYIEANKWNKDTISFKDGKEELAGIRIGSAYVVGPGSRHPDGRDYVVENDVPLATISNDQLDSIIDLMGVKEEKKPVPVAPVIVASVPPPAPWDVASMDEGDKAIFTYNINKVLHYFGINPSATANPIHGSDTGQNWSIKDNEAHCWRCGVHLGPLQLFALLSTKCDCDKVEKHCRGREYVYTKKLFLSAFPDCQVPIQLPECLDLKTLVLPSIDDPINMLNNFALERGELMAIAGSTGKGKSVLATQLGVYLSIGKATVGFDPNGKQLTTLLIQAEDSIRTCVKNRNGSMQFLTKEERELVYENFHITPRLKGICGKRLLDMLEQFYEKYQYDVVLFNPLSRFSHHIDPCNPQQVMEWIDDILRSHLVRLHTWKAV
jgi:hypothetical protein